MPTSEPLPGAPENYWAGQNDAQALADATGASWAAPLFALNQPRMVNIAELCGSPPPVTTPFTTVDLGAAFLPGASHDAAMEKLKAHVDKMLWTNFCQYTDTTPPPTLTPNPPPADLPPNLPDALPGDYIKRIYQATEYIKRTVISRSFYQLASFHCVGEGNHLVFPDLEGNWQPYAAGVRILVTEKPIYKASSGGTADSMWWDLGWVNVGNTSMNAPPVRLNRLETIIYGITARVDLFTWSLQPGVEIDVWPLYPDPGIGGVGE